DRASVRLRLRTHDWAGRDWVFLLRGRSGFRGRNEERGKALRGRSNRWSRAHRQGHGGESHHAYNGGISDAGSSWRAKVQKPFDTPLQPPRGFEDAHETER